MKKKPPYDLKFGLAVKLTLLCKRREINATFANSIIFRRHNLKLSYILFDRENT